MIRILCIFLLYISFINLYSFEESELNRSLRDWEQTNHNQAIVLITSPSSGIIEYAYTKENAFSKKLPAGSILKTLSSFVFLANPEKFHTSWEKNFICNGKFEEPYSNFFTLEDTNNYNLFKNEKSDTFYYNCSLAKGHGEITMSQALALSCNSYYLHFASQSPNFFHNSLLQDWKLDEGTGASFESFSKPKFTRPNKISHFTSSLMSIGNAGIIKVTALKIAQIYGAIFANTQILKPIQKGEMPEVVNPFPYSQNTREKIQEALRLVTIKGTLKNLSLQNTSIQVLGGKTGTPTKDGNKTLTHGWNILYFKKGDNLYLLVVFTENGSGKREALELSSIILNLL